MTGPADTAGEVIGRGLTALVARIHELDPQVRRRDPDAVHQLRVATRRLRSLLTTWRSLLEVDSAEPLRVELRWLTQALAGARDAEVMHARLDRMLHEEGSDLVRIGTGQQIDQ